MTRVHRLHGALVLGLVLAGSGVAAGQSVSASASPSRPLVLTPIDNNIVFSPDVKVTTVNDSTATLVGAYGGRLWDGRLLIGAAGYWLANPRGDERLGYGGVLTGWRLVNTRRFGLDARVLVGAGQGTVYRVVTTFAHADFSGDDRRIGVRDGFLMAEPQLFVQYGVTDLIRITAGVGYRATSTPDRTPSPFSGATGSIGVQFDLGN